MAKTLNDVINFATSTAETERYPTPEEKRLRGTPMQHATTHFAVDETFFAGEWGAEEGCWKVAYSENEYFHILTGKSILRDSAGHEVELNPGDKLCIPAGFEGEWEVLEPTTKVFVIYEP
ncbi:transcriptional regulator [Halioglobus sp. HI00S01]|uniref:cupin domain-containing protein n=1 Tax=Halioglobus sp. HI00S01 TaxID=1822214 RepID=UPI0007C257D7|nr:cupin domain-containing protein [Halioglobus sp. HI00S01]KZX58323.1 transcriptional regulator [Halioglobus sp. HI00S01]